LVLLGVVVGLALGEAGGRLAMLFTPSNPDDFKVADPVLHHRLRPNATTAEGGSEYRIEIRTNSLGLRDREYPTLKPAGAFRILMIGDSTTFGTGLQLEETVAKRAESLLQQGCPRPHEVINGGIPSYSPLLEYLLLKHVGLGLGPDLVVLNFDMTDVRDDFIRTALARLDSDGLPVAVPKNHLAEAALLIPPLPKPRVLRFVEPVEAVMHWSAIYQAIRTWRPVRVLLGPNRLDWRRLEALGLVGNIQYDFVAIARDGDYPGLREAWALTQRYIVGIRDLARSREIPFVLVVPPHAYQVGASEDEVTRWIVGPGRLASERPFQILEDLGRRQGFPVLNLLPLFRERHITEGPLFWSDGIHHNPRGARVFAEGIVNGLRKYDLLPYCK